MPSELQRLRTMHLFAGAGGGILADILLGHQPVCAVEIDEYCQQVLSARQEDGCFPWFPIFADVQKFDGTRWRGLVDCVSGGFPCQDISAAGKGAGITGERSGMWSHMARIIGEVLPRFVYVENSPLLVGRGLALVISDLTALGYDCKWGVLGADDVGAPHERKRLWLVANAEVLHAQGCGLRPGQVESGRSDCWNGGRDGREATWWAVEPELGRVANGVACRVDRLKAIGNGQVPAVAATAWKILGGAA